jgi:hypothetical protein
MFATSAGRRGRARGDSHTEPVPEEEEDEWEASGREDGESDDEDVFFDARDSKYGGAGAGSQHASDQEPEGEAGEAGVSSPERSGA